MKNSIEKGVKNFISSLNATIAECNEEINDGYVVSIDIDGESSYRIYLVIPKSKLDYISELYFGDDNYDIEDLIKEVANQIVGNAKMLMNNENLKLGLPKFLGRYSKNIDYDEKLSFKFNNQECFYILIKEK